MGLIVLPLSLLVLIVMVVMLWIIWTRRKSNKLRRKKGRPTKTIAFFHPYCAAGGRGERVLWKMIQVFGNIHERSEHKLQIVVYTIDPDSPSYKNDMLRHARGRFSIDVSRDLPIKFIHLDDCARMLEPSPRFSLLVESWGTMRLAYQALSRSERCMPDIFMDTTGCAFTYVVARVLFGCQVVAYVHYPTISTDMLQLVWDRRRTAYNHQEYIARSRLTTYVKLTYYVLFAFAYGCVGSLASLVMVNSTWTCRHIESLWKYASWRNRIRIVFPPCNVAGFASYNIATLKDPVILSIGQFRPEKDHVLQLESLASLLKRQPVVRPTLVLIGSCRGSSDEARLQYLQDLTKKLKLEDSVKFVVNQPFSTIEDWLKKASVGIHTMWNEHFGIGVVEMMAAGLIVVAHNSGGPRTDIVLPIDGEPSGFLATTDDEYADALNLALTMNEKEAVRIRGNAKRSAMRFSDNEFDASFTNAILEAKLLQQ